MPELMWQKSSFSGSGGTGECLEVAVTPPGWQKSSFSGPGGANGECIEVTLAPARWQKSSFSGGGNGGECLEVAAAPTLHLRESKNPQTILTPTPAALRALLAHARR
ncbi:hypothetical protein FHS39_001064 [Streptomyces olivoverticillatus]|uniref:DUF397 domain-containing protein n=2 Tax=Streptomyces olivoverticillatus TaxID=66427 RepID=A0A7W7LL69_9ACTN|nr:hypothetical protein [Streptomyces olivoverticillatus]